MIKKYMGFFDFLFKSHKDSIKDGYERALSRYDQELAINITDSEILDR